MRICGPAGLGGWIGTAVRIPLLQYGEISSIVYRLRDDDTATVPCIGHARSSSGNAESEGGVGSGGMGWDGMGFMKLKVSMHRDIDYSTSTGTLGAVSQYRDLVTS
jgi:hypothetical protein